MSSPLPYCVLVPTMLGCGVIKPLPPDHAAQVTSTASPDPPGDRSTPQGEPLPQLENTFGDDARQLVTSASRPWSAVGKLSTGCTATLIDPKLVLTAAHCVLDTDGHFTASHYEFYPNLVHDRSRGVARATFIWYGTKTPLRPGTPFVDDWAILLLDRDLGTTFGWLATKNITPMPGDPVTLTGYSADIADGATATTHVDCHIQPGLLDGQITHDCHMTRGASGGPIWSTAWGDATIVAVQSIEARDGGDTSLHLAGYDGAHPNGAVPIGHFFASLRWVVDNY